MIEVDILMGRYALDASDLGLDTPSVVSHQINVVSHLTLPNVDEPILAHPPELRSDLTFAHFAQIIREHNAKGGNLVGIKLDFKDPAAVIPVLNVLSAVGVGKDIPIWVNADIWQGPGGGIPKFKPVEFLEACRKYCPLASLSVGWTTGPGGLHGIPGTFVGVGGYHPKHINAALRDLRAAGILPEEGVRPGRPAIPVTRETRETRDTHETHEIGGSINDTVLITFPVSVIYTRLSLRRNDTFDRLINASEGCTLTLWGEDTVSGFRNAESGAMGKYTGKIFVDTKPPKFAGILLEHIVVLNGLVFAALLIVPIVLLVTHM